VNTKVECSCVICKKIYTVKGIHTHYDRNHALKEIRLKYSSGNNGSYDIISKRIEQKKIEQIEEYIKSPNTCIICSNIFDFERRNNKFCSHSCSATFTNNKRKEDGWKLSDESKSKISSGVKTHNSIFGLKGGRSVNPLLEQTCKQCDKVFYSKKIKLYCGVNCSKIIKKAEVESRRTPLQNYRANCAFKFSLKDYPDEFDFALIITHGWYKAKNRGNNQTGVSRDHAVSVRYGFDNNLPSEHLAHPANCILMQHNKNVSKGIKNTFSYEDLLIKIKEWDEKYPPRQEFDSPSGPPSF